MRGEPGSGRTTLLDAAVQRADTQNVVRIDGAATDVEVDLAAVTSVIWPLRRHVAHLVPLHASVLAGALGTGATVSVDPLVVGAALLSLVGIAADDAPVVLAVDDLDDADGPSVAALLFVARRLLAESVVFVATVRTDAAIDLDGIEVIEIDSMTGEEARRVLRRASGRPVAPDVAEHLALAVHGNPAALAELAIRLSPAELLGVELLPELLPVDPAGSEVLVIDALPSSTRDAVVALAALGPSTDGELDAVLVRLGLDRRDILPAVGAGLIAEVGGRHRFARASTRTSCLASCDVARLRRVHGEIAAVLSNSPDIERQARHLARAVLEPDDATAAVLVAAAEHAGTRLAHALSSELYEAAARVSEQDEARAGLLVEAAMAALAAGAFERAAALGASVSTDADQVTRARADLVRFRSAPRRRAIDGLHADAVAIAEVAPDLAAAMLLELTGFAVAASDTRTAVVLAVEAERVSGLASRQIQARVAVVSAAARLAGGATEADTTAVRGWRALIDDDARSIVLLLGSVVWTLILGELFEDAAALADTLIEYGRAEAPGVLPSALLTSAILSFSTGEWDRMEADILESAELAEATGAKGTAVLARHNAALFCSLRGRSDWRDHLDRAVALADGHMSTGNQLHMATTVAGHSYAEGDVDGCIAALLPALALDTSPNPGALLASADLAEAYITVGDRAHARPIVEDFEARAIAAQHRRSIARAAALRGALTDERSAGDELFDRAEAMLTAPLLPFVLARVRLLRARWLVSHDDAEAARHVGASARATFDSLDAANWAARAREVTDIALADPGDRGPELTMDERRVVDSLLDGASVGQVAARLLRSPRTVEHHLATALVKLGVSNREALRHVVGAVDEVNIDALVRVTLLGRFEVRSSDDLLTPPPGVVARLLQIVCMSGGSLHVDEVIESLWPETTPEKGRTRLRTALTRLRRSSGSLVVRSGDLLALAPNVEVDVLRFRADAAAVLGGRITDRDVAERTAAAALATCGGDLLPESIYEAWTVAARERLRRDRLLLVDLLVGWRIERGATGEAIELLEQAIEIDPYDDSRYARLGRALLLIGQRSAASAAARRGQRVAIDLGLEPSVELAAIEAAARAPHLT